MAPLTTQREAEPSTHHSLESFALRPWWIWRQAPEPVAGDLNLDLDLALFSLTTYSTSLGLHFLVRKMAWMLRLM